MYGSDRKAENSVSATVNKIPPNFFLILRQKNSKSFCQLCPVLSIQVEFVWVGPGGGWVDLYERM